VLAYGVDLLDRGPAAQELARHRLQAFHRHALRGQREQARAAARDKGEQEVLGPRYAKRHGGYLRILKSGMRKGDNATMALVTLMDRPEPKAEEKKPAEERKAA
jgi:hypothetical protein